MPRKQVGQIDADLLDRVDVARGDVPRTKFVERALERALDEDPFGPVSGRRMAPPLENRGAAPPQVSAHVRPAIPKGGS